MSVGHSQVYRKRKVPENRTSNVTDTDSDDSASRESCEVRKIARMTPRSNIENGEAHSDTYQSCSFLKEDSSDSDSNESEKCPICLKAFRSQTLCITDSCRHHTFCLSCLEEWSKTKKTCPVDRKEYQSILVLDSKGKISKQISIKSLAAASEGPWTQTNQPTFCEICGLYNNEERMLLCDGCDMGFHMYCLSPQIDRVPTGMWLCNECWYYYNY